MLYSFFILLILLLQVGCLPTGRSAAFGANETDQAALLAFKSMILHDPQGALSSWNNSFHFCQWEGITCSRRHQRVTILDLSARGLVGSLSPYVGNLSFLRDIMLQNNSLEGEIPPEVGHLFRLRRLSLTKNSFEGEIPVNLSRCPDLIGLGLGYNKLVGRIPNELRSLLKLKYLSLHDNSFIGGIPTFIRNLTSLEIISAAANPLGGNIPDIFAQSTNLRELGLGGLGLYGMVPPSIYNLSLLRVFSLASNQLSGGLQKDMGLFLPHLENIQVWGNNFTGPLPVSISNCSNLKKIDASTNYFNGKVAIDFGGLVNLTKVILLNNNLGSGDSDEMNFVASMANCSILEVLGLNENHFMGLLPSSVGNLSTQLSQLTLGTNLIYGSLPSTIGNLLKLTSLGLERNQFTGTIPTSIGTLQNLRRLYLGENNFSGKIPDSIGNLSSLIELYLSKNLLEGNIPLSLGNCQKLLLLLLSQNSLNGTIPKLLFRLSALSISLDLSRNHLVGTLPLEIGNLKNIMELDLSENDLSGDIPGSLGSCTSLENLHLEGNFFEGHIPPSLSSLRGVQILDLSRNNFSGQIPKFLEQFSLINLNLSFNDFEGDVPIKGIFTNLSAISVVGNNRLCGGVPALLLHKCTIKQSKKHRKWSPKVVIVVSILFLLLGVIVMLSIFLSWRKRKCKTRPSSLLLQESFRKVSYETLFKATDGFSPSNLIGVGSFGSVYKGLLQQDRDVVAIKVLNLQHEGASRSFMAECEALRNIRHRNLVKVITSCSTIDFQGNEFKALVYEFMPNGSLERWLHPETQNGQDELHGLGLLHRINIAIDVACALDYLHHQCENPIIHCDIKPSNILLDESMVAHVGDFGLAKLLHEHTDAIQSSSLGVRGTIGYAAPEYGMGSELSVMGDVYSYGILLLEMMTGKRPTDPMLVEGLNLHNFANMSLSDPVMEAWDPILLNSIRDEVAATAGDTSTGPRNKSHQGITVECLKSIIKIGVACSRESAQERMNMSSVLVELHSVRKFFQGSLSLV